MDNDAFGLAKSIRYQDDVERVDWIGDESLLDNIKLTLSLSSLKVTKDLTPEIYNALCRVCDRLKLDINLVEVFVSSSPDIQAGCISVNTKGCIVTLNSSLLNLVSIDELEFVIAHELGHFLLQHGSKVLDTSPESSIAQRAMEISVDRVGVCGCKDLDTAIRAIMKLLSGLDENFLRFDVHSFLNQLDHESINQGHTQNQSTHPSLLLRAKSLVRFVNSRPYQKLKNNMGGTELTEVDALIRKDLDHFNDKQIRDQEKISKEQVGFWILVFSLTKEGGLSKDSQDMIAHKFGEDKKNKLLKMLRSLSKSNAKKMVAEKLKDAISRFRELAPEKAKRELNLIINEIEKGTSDKDLLSQIQRMI